MVGDRGGGRAEEPVVGRRGRGGGSRVGPGGSGGGGGGAGAGGGHGRGLPLRPHAEVRQEPLDALHWTGRGGPRGRTPAATTSPENPPATRGGEGREKGGRLARGDRRREKESGGKGRGRGGW